MERGTAESADNRDIICRVKAGAKGNYASTIKWVIDDGSLVRRGQLIMVLDSSSLEDQYRTQKIALDTAHAAWIGAEQQYKITVSTNESTIATAQNNIQLAELDLEKYAGLPKGTLVNRKREAARGLLLELEADLQSCLARRKDEFPDAEGEYHKLLNEWGGKIELSEADVEICKDRVAYSQRMQLKGYLSPAQVQADESRLASARETLKQYKAEKQLLQNFTAQRTVKDFSGKVQEAWRALDRTLSEATAKEVQAEADRKTKRSVYIQEEEKLKDIEEQLGECKIHAPQDGMVVYYIPESSRWSQSERGLIQQGATVQEGQKMMRIPDLDRMQVSTRVHEAMVSRIRGDDRRSTGVHESVQAGLLLNLSPVNALLSQVEPLLEEQRTQYREKEYYEAARGMPASIRVDAFPDKVLKGHVRTVATVASSDNFMSDVKVYATVVAIDDQVPGLKPGMSAEVTIHVNNTIENVLTIPVQAVIGGAESGRTRKVIVMTADGPVEREVQLGLSNEKMAEVRSGLEAGDQVVVNPKAVVGDTAKTREDMPQGKMGGGFGKGKGKGKGGMGDEGGGPPGGPNGGNGKGKGGPPPATKE
jgi:HlyD family secretion protein